MKDQGDPQRLSFQIICSRVGMTKTSWHFIASDLPTVSNWWTIDPLGVEAASYAFHNSITGSHSCTTHGEP